jgi:hypothetical protein
VVVVEQQIVEGIRALSSTPRTGIIEVSMFQFTSHATTQVV